MLHIVFQQADVTLLQKAFELDETMAGNIVEIKDDFAVGPIKNIYESEAYEARREWWKSLVDYSPYKTGNLMDLVDDAATVLRLKTVLDEEPAQEVWVWMGQNQHDVCGYYWLISQLKDYSGRLFVLYLNNLPFINEKGSIFYPTALHQIQPKEFLKAKKLCRKITPGEFETDPDEWKKLMDEGSAVRILEGGKKIAGRDESFYDESILNGLTIESQKGNKAMHNIIGKMSIRTGDVFILWRLRELALQDKVEIIGDPAKGWKEFEVKLKTTAEQDIETTNDPI